MKIAVVGAGSWGTALAQVLANRGHDVLLWARREAVADAINASHKNPDYLVDAPLSERIVASSDLAFVLDGVAGALVVTPSKYARQTAKSIAEVEGCTCPVLLCMKGIEAETGMAPFEVFADELGADRPIAALSGPNHAEEVVYGVPAATVVASHDPDTATFFRDLLTSREFRVYTSDDILGVELCAAFKNVIAIAVGVSYGMGYGDNTAAMLMTRGQAEMGRLIAAAGGDPMTCMGLAGTGDLIATCMSRHSRNRMFGEACAAGTTLEEYEAERHMVVEGAQACLALETLSRRFDVELPITDTVRALVWEGKRPADLIRALAARPPKPEFY